MPSLNKRKTKPKAGKLVLYFPQEWLVKKPFSQKNLKILNDYLRKKFGLDKPDNIK